MRSEVVLESRATPASVAGNVVGNGTIDNRLFAVFLDLGWVPSRFPYDVECDFRGRNNRCGEERQENFLDPMGIKIDYRHSTDGYTPIRHASSCAVLPTTLQRPCR